jgi:hypothetical protein
MYSNPVNDHRVDVIELWGRSILSEHEQYHGCGPEEARSNGCPLAVVVQSRLPVPVF